MSPGGATTPVPNRLREHRLALGLEQVAERIGALTDGGTSLDEHAVSRHERGLHQPRRFYRQLYCQLYQADEAELWPRSPSLLRRDADQPDSPGADYDPVLVAPWDRGGTVEAAVALTGSGGLVERRTLLFLTGAALTAPAHQWLVHEPGPLVSALRGDRVTPALADRLPPMIAELRRMDDLHSPGVVLALAEREFTWVAGLLNQGSYDEPTGRRLHVALAELGQIAGFAAYDQGDRGLAQRYYVTALRAAHTADDRAVGANILKFMAEQSAYVGRPQDALTLIDSALTGVRGSATPAQSALLYSWKAYAHAVLREEPACLAAITSARTHAERIEREDTPPWLYWLRPTDITVHAGDALLQLDRPKKAEPLLESGSEAFTADRHVGDQQHYLVRLAAAQLANDKLDGAALTDHRALVLVVCLQNNRRNRRVDSTE